MNPIDLATLQDFAARHEAIPRPDILAILFFSSLLFSTLGLGVLAMASRGGAGRAMLATGVVACGTAAIVGLHHELSKIDAGTLERRTVTADFRQTGACPLLVETAMTDSSFLSTRDLRFAKAACIEDAFDPRP